VNYGDILAGDVVRKKFLNHFARNEAGELATSVDVDDSAVLPFGNEGP